MNKLMYSLNDIFQSQVWGNSIESYAFSLLVFLVLLISFSIGKRMVVHYLGKLAALTVSDIDDFVVTLISRLGWPVIAVIALYISTSSLVLPEAVRSLIRYAAVFVITVRAILMLQSIVEYCINKLLSKRMGRDNPSFRSMAAVIAALLKWSMWVLGGVFILSNLGINVSSLVAGIGIGGIAVAMASQAVLGDAFSAVAIYLDKPFEVGDFIIIDDTMGSVEHIGIKTTRIRSLSGEQLVFANSDLTKSRIRNYKRMQTRRVVFKIAISNQTPVDQVVQVPDMIREILKKNEVQIERVHFLSIVDFSLIYEIAYHVSSADYNVYMDKQQAINIEIMRLFQQEHIQFANPTQTLYIASHALDPQTA